MARLTTILSLPNLTLAASGLLLLASAIHYPLATTFPIGGDAASYIRDSQQLLNAFTQPQTLIQPSTYSRYPTTQATFAAFAIFPLSWAERYTWFAAFSLIASGLALGLLLYRLGGWRATALGISLWAATAIGAQPHFEDGTIAQLLSLAPLFLYLERLQARAYRSAAALIFIAFFTHPITGIIALFTAYTAIVATPIQPRNIFFRHFTLPILIVTILAAVAVTSLGSFFTNVKASDDAFIVGDSIRSPLAPLWILAPIGAILISRKYRHNRPATAALLSFFALSLLFAQNHLLGISVWTDRFSTYLLTAVTALSALSLATLLRLSLPHASIHRTILANLFIAIVLISGWSTAHATYAYYESPSRYARLHPQEHAAFLWMHNHLPSDSVIISTQENRHTEWIPIITPFTWQGFEDDLHNAALRDPSYTHAIYLKKREKPPQVMFDTYTVIYDTKAATIFALHP